MYCRNCGSQVDDNAVVCISCGVPPLKGSKHCQNCGKDVNEMSEVCVSCGVKLITQKATDNLSGKSEKDWTTTLILCIFLGAVGVHRFYTGHTVWGIVYILTFGGFFGIGPVIDLIMIISGNFKDSDGRLVTNK
ncbi:MAG TPA: TM2 domain-containing protein [Candidatus Cloacimonetes bacterium]|nr:TM2 domain-containing protein [Petrimonas mucosa]HHZ15069.1 TM2 domain-containing protein [Candidatus Cloacimonadota bacterium]